MEVVDEEQRPLQPSVLEGTSGLLDRRPAVVDAAHDGRERRAEVEVRNQADAVSYQVDRRLKELGDRAPANERARAESIIQEIRQMVAQRSTDVSRLKQLTSDLQQLEAGLATGSAHAGAATGSGPGGQRKPEEPDDVIDAEFRPES